MTKVLGKGAGETLLTRRVSPVFTSLKASGIASFKPAFDAR
jgi:hypothetical protein